MEKVTKEQMLKAVIDAQGNGGLTKWNRKLYGGQFILSNYLLVMCSKIEKEKAEADPNLRQMHILEILLDPEGLRAAYGDSITEEQSSLIKGGTIFNIGVTYFWKIVAQMITDSWLSKPQGDTEGAIQTAYDLLPKA